MKAVSWKILFRDNPDLTNLSFNLESLLLQYIYIYAAKTTLMSDRYGSHRKLCARTVSAFVYVFEINFYIAMNRRMQRS